MTEIRARQDDLIRALRWIAVAQTVVNYATLFPVLAVRQATGHDDNWHKIAGFALVWCAVLLLVMLQTFRPIVGSRNAAALLWIPFVVNGLLTGLFALFLSGAFVGWAYFVVGRSQAAVDDA